jgi:hypothetical protein
MLKTSEKKCNIKLDIPIELINQIQPELTKNYEISGVINCNEHNQVIGISKNKGNKDSVYTPNHVINFHTHPISAYNEGNTVWGWPSGEDIRETIKFSLAGNKAHMVFTVEGIYVIQMNSCKVKKLKNVLDPVERGVLIFIIEEYFKCTHNFRCIDEISKLKTKITPESYINYINNFDLERLLIKNNQKNSFGNIPGFGFPEIKNNKIKNTRIKEYLQKSDLSDLMVIDSLGKESQNNKIKTTSQLFIIIEEVYKKMGIGKCTNTWNNKPNSWFYVNFFASVYYTNNMFLHQNGVPRNPNINDSEYLTIIETPYIKIFSNSSDGCTMHQISKINNFSVGKNNIRNILQNSKNTFGNLTITPEQRYVILYVLFLNPYNSLEVLLLKINTFIKKNNLKIELMVLPEVRSELSSLLNKTR